MRFINKFIKKIIKKFPKKNKIKTELYLENWSDIEYNNVRFIYNLLSN